MSLDGSGSPARAECESAADSQADTTPQASVQPLPPATERGPRRAAGVGHVGAPPGTVHGMEPTTIETPSWLPLVLSAAALAVSLFALGWQVQKHLLDGARVRVWLDPAMWLPGTVIRTAQSRHGQLTADSSTREVAVECAVVTVVNVGRTPVTISAPGIAYRGERRRWRLRRTLHTITPRLFQLGEGFSGYSTDTKACRLEPYDHALYVFDIHTVLEAAREDRGRDRVVLRGSVAIAALRRSVLTRWKRRWVVPATMATLVGFGPTMPLERLIMLRLARESGSEDRMSDLDYIARVIAAKLVASRDSSESTLELVDEAVKATLANVPFAKHRPPLGIAAFNIAQALDASPERVDWSGAEYELRTFGATPLWQKARGGSSESD